MASERLEGEEQFHSKNKLLEMSRSHANMPLESAPQKLNSAKAISKSYTVYCCLQMSLHIPAKLHIVTQSRFR